MSAFINFIRKEYTFHCAAVSIPFPLQLSFGCWNVMFYDWPDLCIWRKQIWIWNFITFSSMFSYCWKQIRKTFSDNLLNILMFDSRMPNGWRRNHSLALLQETLTVHNIKKLNLNTSRHLSQSGAWDLRLVFNHSFMTLYPRLLTGVKSLCFC
jgi:hypothetical protein